MVTMLAVAFDAALDVVDNSRCPCLWVSITVSINEALFREIQKLVDIISPASIVLYCPSVTQFNGWDTKDCTVRILLTACSRPPVFVTLSSLSLLSVKVITPSRNQALEGEFNSSLYAALRWVANQQPHACQAPKSTGVLGTIDAPHLERESH